MLPEEDHGQPTRDAVQQFESTVIRWLIRLIPLWLVAGWLVIGPLRNTILFLQPVRPFRHWMATPAALLAGIAVVSGCLATGLLWFLGRKLSSAKPNMIGWFGFVVGVTMGVVVCGNVLNETKVRFTLEESVKSRAPQLDFVRNIAFKQQELRLPADQPAQSSQPRIAIIGSSQINLGIDVSLLKKQTLSEDVISVCMPGMVPVQYLALRDDLIAKSPTHVVCWVSEFDFFRESHLPTVRLRWCVDRDNLPQIASTLTLPQKYQNRSQLADLSLASIMPLWQQRSLLQLALFRFWWGWDAEGQEIDKDEAAIGGRLADKEQGIKNVRQNISRTPMVESNFAAFSQFANIFDDVGIQLIVIEGETHPDAMKVYPHKFRMETRQRLAEMAEKNRHFRYITEAERPAFDESDWRDAVHLNELGRMKLTTFVAEMIQEIP